MPNATASAAPVATTSCAPLRSEFFIGDERAAELPAQLRHETVRSESFTSEDEGDLPTIQFARDMAKGCGTIRVAHRCASARGARCTPDTTVPPLRDHGINRFKQQARAILYGATIIVITHVAAILQELIEQIAVRCVELHAVETRQLRILSPVGLPR